MFKCSAITGGVFSRHDIKNHDESSARLYAACEGIPDVIPIIEPKIAREEDLLRVHTHSHVHMIHEFSCHGGQHFIDQNTYVNGESFEIASFAAGAAIEAVNRSISGEHSFALVRPPGHHAEPDRAMGFCIFNNAAIAATVALDQIDRVAIIDWDLHHGNGTQKIFYKDDRVLFCSIHQGNTFPNTGWVDEIGLGKGKGYTINAPLRPGSTIADYRFVFEQAFIPALEQFRPDVVIVSAGQDALSDDPKSGMLLFPKDFGTLTQLMMNATKHPLSLILEGGYGPSHSDAIAAIFSALKGSSDLPEHEGEPHRTTQEIVAAISKMTT